MAKEWCEPMSREVCQTVARTSCSQVSSATRARGCLPSLASSLFSNPGPPVPRCLGLTARMYPALSAVWRKVEVLEVLRSFWDIFSQKLRLLRRKKHLKMASIGNFCDRFPCEITESLKPFGSCHKRCIHSLGLAIM